MYNNENGVDVNGNIERYIDEGRNRLYKEQEKQIKREYNWEEYNNWEQSIKTIAESDFTQSERQSINKAKTEYNKDIVLNENNRKSNNNSTELNDMLNNKDLPMQYYQYEKSDNVKVNTLKESASKYFNNSEQTKNYISMLEKIVTDKNVEIKFDSNLKTADGKIANGSYSNGVITINPNSTRTGEFIAIHELTHAIGTDSMKNIIETYMESNNEFL